MMFSDHVKLSGFATSKSTWSRIVDKDSDITKIALMLHTAVQVLVNSSLLTYSKIHGRPFAGWGHLRFVRGAVGDVIILKRIAVVVSLGST